MSGRRRRGGAGFGATMSEVIGSQVLERLARLQQWAGHRVAEPERVRDELCELIGWWRRRLLQAHTPAEGERFCPRCPRSGWRRQSWPCDVWRVAHASLISAPDPAVAGQPTGAEPELEVLPGLVIQGRHVWCDDGGSIR